MAAPIAGTWLDVGMGIDIAGWGRRRLFAPVDMVGEVGDEGVTTGAFEVDIALGGVLPRSV